MWKKRETVPGEGGIRIPSGAGGGRIGAERDQGIQVGSTRDRVRKQIIFTGILFVALFVIMTASFTGYATFHRRELFDNDYNGRDVLLEEHNRRGTIFGNQNGEKVVLASSDDNNNRYYPYGEMFCHAVGYSVLGGSGIDEYMKYELLHSDIPFKSKLEYDRKKELYPGNDVYTTLEYWLQYDAYNALKAEDLRGAVVITQPKTGRILAMVSNPGFDPNTIAQIWEYLQNDQSGNAQLLNRATQGLYAPGSTFKIVDAVEFLQEDPSAIYSFSFNCDDGWYEYDGESIHCFEDKNHRYEVHGTQDLAEAFAHSCNSAFASIVTEKLDRDRFKKTLKRMMFDSPLPYDLPYSASHSQLLEDGDISAHNLMQVAIGQGTTEVSPLHMNMITMAVANGGVLMRPYLVDKVCTAEDVTLKEYEPRKAGILMNDSTAKEVRKLMRGVTKVTYKESDGSTVWGTASEFDGTKTYYAFGKTGTAEFGTDEDSHAWFTGFTVKAEDGEDGEADLCITVLIENGGVGSDKAVPIAKNILNAWYEEP